MELLDHRDCAFLPPLLSLVSVCSGCSINAFRRKESGKKHLVFKKQYERLSELALDWSRACEAGAGCRGQFLALQDTSTP